MSYDLSAVIAEERLLTAAAASLSPARTAQLDQGFALIPVTAALSEAVAATATADDPGFYRLPGGFDELLAKWSLSGPVAFVDSEYFGGVGEESAAVWRHGAMDLGPLRMREGDLPPAEGTPTVQALRALGVHAAPGQDEFTSVGLDRHRSVLDWLA